MRQRQAYVHMHLEGRFVLAGRLDMVEDGRYSLCSFRYGDRYLARPDAVAVDPVRLPLEGASRRVFEGAPGGELFGGLRDASPDAWGRHVLDTAAESAGETLTEFDYLMCAGPQRIGALGFSHSRDEAPFARPPVWAATLPGAELDLAGLLQAADTVEHEEFLEARFRRFLVRGSSLGGARPKAAVEWDGAPWIAKFDKAREAWPTCRVEFAAMRLAGLCGIRVPQTRLERVCGNRNILLVRRFDRRGPERLPFVSAVTMLGLTQAQAEKGAAYADMATALRRHGRADGIGRDLEELFRRMVFNIFCNNTDDHLRNHGFVYDAEGKGGWRLSPAYDIVPQPVQDSGTRLLHLGVGPQGRAATLANAVAGCAVFGLERGQARGIIQDMRSLLAAHGEQAFQQAGCPPAALESLRQCFRQVWEEKSGEA